MRPIVDIVNVLVYNFRIMSDSKERGLTGFSAANEIQYGDIKSKSTVVFSILESDIARYQDVARNTGFEMEIVAGPGEYYLRAHVINLEYAAKIAESAGEFSELLVVRPVVSELPVKLGSVAISLRKPADQADHSAFHEAFRNPVI